MNKLMCKNVPLENCCQVKKKTRGVGGCPNKYVKVFIQLRRDGEQLSAGQIIS